jgi:chromosomal replication initiator protein
MHSLITDEPSLLDVSRTQVEAISQQLAKRIGAQKYRIWFKDSAQLSLSDGYFRVGVPNTFTARWIENHFLSDIETVVEEVTGVQARVSLSVVADMGAAKPSLRQTKALTDTKTKPRPQAQPMRPPHATNSKPRLKLALDSFVVGPSNELAYNAAQVVVREQQSPFNPLFIHGGYGVGKTHILQGICNAVSQTRPQTKWFYLSAEDFANQFILALKTKKLETFRRRMRQTDLLAIDDIHFFSNKPSTQEEFLHTFNTINLAGKQVVLVSDAPPKQIDQLSDKLVNRFVSGMVVKIDSPDFETRYKICQQRAVAMIKAAFHGKGTPSGKQARVPDSVLRYIAEHVHTNARELEGALLKVVAYAALQNETINLSMTKDVLADHVERCDPIVHLSDIESTVASFFGVTPAHLHSTKKDKTVSLARHYSMYLARKHTNMSSSEVGRLMGKKNHATVLVACKRIEDLVERNAELHWRGPSGNRIARAKATLTKLEGSISK